MDDPDHGDAMVTIAIVVSRIEALVLVSVLEAAGILASAGGVQHASVEVNSLALGGHRVWVPASQWAEASAILRETGASSDWEFSLACVAPFCGSSERGSASTAEWRD